MKLLTPIVILLVSLLDDALFLGLSQLDLHLPWLQRLSPVIMVAVFIHLALQFWHRHRSHAAQANHPLKTSELRTSETTPAD